jgi:ankyrin repeat protein
MALLGIRHVPGSGGKRSLPRVADAKGVNGGTPLHLAAVARREDVAEVLLTKSAYGNARGG